VRAQFLRARTPPRRGAAKTETAKLLQPIDLIEEKAVSAAVSEKRYAKLKKSITR
jgi:hypothetical protein